MMSSVNHDDFAHLKIPLENIRSATNNFDEENFWGESDFAKFYRGQLLWSGELTNIHARRWLNEEMDDEKEHLFWTEISMLSSLEHKNLVSLVGFCDENDEKIIIIKLETRGSLSRYLSDPMWLSWVRRLKISLGIAHALSYIHYDEPRDFSVIHRNITSGTVYLNDDWEPKLSGFERSMSIEASKRHHSFNNGACTLTTGYVDSTFMETNTVNHKLDMYSFGIVLFELLCGRKSIIDSDSNKYLASLAVTHYKEKRLNEIIDWDLWSQMDSQSINIFAETAYECLNEERSQRPNIVEIVTRLERALELQLEHQNEIMNEFAHLRVPLQNILSATNNFNEENVLLEDGIEKRYKGQLLWSGELIEIEARRFNKEWKQAEQRFWTEISMLSSLKHKNVVSLVGFCDDNDEKIIITRRETRGVLYNYLSDPMLLTWVRRLEISMGVAHALSYIHYDEPRDFSVIHRCIDSSRVLLNDEWKPKLSDFDRSMKIKASQRHHSFHTNEVWYVKGYRDPTYIETKSVNHKSDIYSFGMVLFELLCGRKALSDEQDNKYLGPMAIFHYKKRILDEIIDPILWKQMNLQSFNVFAKTAYDCLNEERSRRPNINEIVTRLESALKLQMECQNAEHLIAAAEVEDTSSNHDKQVCLYMHDPREPHFSALKRILRYVQGTLSYGLQLFSFSTDSLVAYSDADWAGCPTTRRFTSGYCVFLGNNLLSWSSKRQPTLSRSSAEAEYRGVANAVAETCWLRNLLRELHTPLSSATIVYCDNVSAVYLSSNPVQHQRTKHIEIDIHFVRDLVAAGQVRVLHVPSRFQYADIFTKGLPSALFAEFRDSLSVRSPPAQTAGEC